VKLPQRESAPNAGIGVVPGVVRRLPEWVLRSAVVMVAAVLSSSLAVLVKTSTKS